jgi:hypothetical protein
LKFTEEKRQKAIRELNEAKVLNLKRKSYADAARFPEQSVMQPSTLETRLSKQGNVTRDLVDSILNSRENGPVAQTFSCKADKVYLTFKSDEAMAKAKDLLQSDPNEAESSSVPDSHTQPSRSILIVKSVGVSSVSATATKQQCARARKGAANAPASIGHPHATVDTPFASTVDPTINLAVDRVQSKSKKRSDTPTSSANPQRLLQIRFCVFNASFPQIYVFLSLPLCSGSLLPYATPTSKNHPNKPTSLGGGQ